MEIGRSTGLSSYSLTPPALFALNNIFCKLGKLVLPIRLVLRNSTQFLARTRRVFLIHLKPTLQLSFQPWHILKFVWPFSLFLIDLYTHFFLVSHRRTELNLIFLFSQKLPKQSFCYSWFTMHFCSSLARFMLPTWVILQNFRSCATISGHVFSSFFSRFQALCFQACLCTTSRS